MATKTVKKKSTNGAAPAYKNINILVKTWLLIKMTIEGLNRLVPRAMDAKVAEDIILKQMKMATKSTKEEARDPVVEAKSGLYRFALGGYGSEVMGTIYGLKAVALKKAVVRPFKTIDKYSMQDAKGGFHVLPAGKCWMDRDDLIPIISTPVKGLSFTEKQIAEWTKLAEAEMLTLMEEEHKYGCSIREDIVRIQSGASIPRYRCEFNTWKIPFEVEYNSDWCSAEILYNAIDRAGREVGLGENRPEKSGDNWGTFRVADTK